ncbi:MAG: hypothetical protein AAF655_12100 [Bacteroidota bacterium]
MNTLFSNISGLGDPSAKPIGSVREVRLLRASELLGGYEPVKLMVDESKLILPADSSWKTYYFAPDTCRFREAGKKSPNGLYFQLTLEGIHPDLRNEVDLELMNMQNGSYVAILSFYNGQTKLVGTPHSPLTLEPIIDTKTSREGSAAYSFKFTGKGRFPSPTILLQEEIPVDPCAALNESDWSYDPWTLTNGVFNFLFVSPDVSGAIQNILTYPTGTIESPLGNVVDRLEYNSVSGVYGPLNIPGPTLQGVCRAIIRNIKVALKSGEICSHDFVQEYLVEGSGGDFDPTDFEIADFNTETA